MKYNADAHAKFVAARAEYLSANGWVPDIPKVPGGPVWWRDPLARPNEQDCMLDEYAANLQEHRDNDQEKMR